MQFKLSIKNVLHKPIVKVTTFSGLATLVKLITGFISIKFAAIQIGAEGIAVIGNFQNFIALCIAAGSASLGQGIVKYISENGNGYKSKSYFIAALQLIILASLITGIVLAIFNGILSEKILNSNRYGQFVLVLAIMLWALTFQVYVSSVINGLQQYKKFVTINILSNIIGLISSIILIWQFKLQGALLSCILSPVTSAIVSFIFVRNEKWLPSNTLLLKRVKSIYYTRLLRYSLMAIVVAFIGPISQIIIRNIIQSRISLAAAGYWEALNRMSSVYLMIITTSLSTYYLPKLSSLQLNDELKSEIQSTLKTACIPLLLIIACVYLSRGIILETLFSKEFRHLSDVIYIQLVGDFFKMISWIFGLVFWAKALHKQFIFIEVLFSCFYVISSYVMTYYYGFEGVLWAYVFLYIMYLISVGGYIYFRYFNNKH